MLKQLKTVLLTAGVLLYILTGCKKKPNISSLNERVKNTTTKSAERSAIITGPLSSGQASSRPPIPDQLAANLQLTAQFLNQHAEYRDLLRKLASADEPSCNNNTAFFQWMNDQLADWTPEMFQFYNEYYIDIFVFYYPYLYVNIQDGQYFGINGEYSQRVYKTFKDLKRFWNINSDNMIVVAAHGNVLTNKEIIARMITDLFDLSPGEDANVIADYIAAVINFYPQFKKGNHPVFTANAYAFRGGFVGPAGLVPPKIVLGDGFLDDFAAIGYGDVSPQAILAHEYGHEVQYQLGIFANGTPEASRRVELMADAYSAYYLSHASGAAMQWKRVKEFLQVFYGIGDCAFTDSGHHGTPNQRMAAAEWAYNLANNARPQGSIITGEQFAVLFDAALPGILLH